MMSGNDCEMFDKYTTKGATMLATYPIMWINATPCALTTVGNNSAAYCNPILYEIFTLNLPNIANVAENAPKILNDSLI